MVRHVNRFNHGSDTDIYDAEGRFSQYVLPGKLRDHP